MGTDAKKPAKQKSRLHMTHAQNDARYMAQGMTLFLSPNPDSAKDLARMNKGKNGRPFIYDEETMMVVAGIVYQLGLACRGCEGLAVMALGEENAPDHTTIWRRINKMDVTSVDDTVEVRSKNGMLRLIPGGTGLAPSTRSEWIHHKHKVKRGWIRLSIMVDHDTMKVLAFRVTDERIVAAIAIRSPFAKFRKTVASCRMKTRNMPIDSGGGDRIAMAVTTHRRLAPVRGPPGGFAEVPWHRR